MRDRKHKEKESGRANEREITEMVRLNKFISSQTYTCKCVVIAVSKAQGKSSTG